MAKDPNSKQKKQKEVDRDRKHDSSSESRDQADDPRRAPQRSETGGQEQPGGHGPTTPGTSSDPDSPD